MEKIEREYVRKKLSDMISECEKDSLRFNFWGCFAAAIIFGTLPILFLTGSLPATFSVGVSIAATIGSVCAFINKMIKYPD